MHMQYTRFDPSQCMSKKHFNKHKKGHAAMTHAKKVACKFVRHS